ncbi:MAG: adenylosuccinate lyase [Actinobacteria bacterium QS_5_72_10]|nr:MAG: adenylosuccinate lyase [Actinobacteria bacterium QS_5_72_10]
MISRYTRPEMAELLSEEAKLATWVEVEVRACEAHHQLGVVPAEDLAAIQQGRPPSPRRVAEIEAETDHDVIAFVTAFAETIPPRAGDEPPAGTPVTAAPPQPDLTTTEHPSRWVHYGMTSSDLVDTALGATLARATDLVLAQADALVAALRDRGLEHFDDVCPGRTHGVHAEPSTFGHILGQLAFAADRGRARLRRARQAVAVGSISGAVGTYAHLDPFVEAYVCDQLGLAIEPVPTQVVGRDRHAELISALAGLGATCEQLGTEIRHRQRTEVSEAAEAFGAGQKGSSAMPHKRNPIKSERLCGLARLLRGYVVPAYEDVALWHERDISHSSVERVILPDALAAAHYQLCLAARGVRELVVDAERMRANLAMTGGLMSSSRVLLELIDQRGWSRDAAYKVVQAAAARTWETGTPLVDELAEEGVEIDEGVLAPESFLARHAVVRQRLEALEA